MKLVIGLGNPGLEYVNTRHNLGYFILENFLKTKSLKLDKEKFDSIYTIDGVGEDRVIYMEPTTFMNLSGQSIRQIVNFYKIEIKDILVIYDDLDLPLSKLRVRTKGSAGGHNGIKSIISQLGSEDFNRLRVGIGKDDRIDTSKYVLGKFSNSESELIKQELENYFSEIESFIKK
jgi:PTH1 family peptidyl-tRNA hydrolase